MIRQITRHEIVSTKNLIGSELAQLQQAIFDEETLQFCKDNNEEQGYLEQFDCIHTELILPETYSKIIGLKHSDINTFTSELTTRLETLFLEIGVTELVLISHLKLDFFGNRNNDFQPLVNAYRQLEKSLVIQHIKKHSSLNRIHYATLLKFYFGLRDATPIQPNTFLYLIWKKPFKFICVSMEMFT